MYGAVAMLALGVAAVRGTNPLETAPWIDAPPWLRTGVSLFGGAALAAATVGVTRAFVKHARWAKLLHADLQPSVRGAGDGTILVLGLASGVAEELFFRGLLAASVGLVFSSVAFGALHQLRGRAGWIWSSWAALMGLLFGGLFLLTGDLLGPILAHVAINVVNLRFLRDTQVEPQKPRPLGGLLRTR